jgi:uncharacterized protein
LPSYSHDVTDVSARKEKWSALPCFLARQDVAADLIAAVVEVLATDAAHLVPPYVRGLQYLAPPSMIQTGVIPLHQAAVGAYRKLHG